MHGLIVTTLTEDPILTLFTVNGLGYLLGEVSFLGFRFGIIVVLFVGLAGWRAAVNRHAAAGIQPNPFGGRPAYVMPSTSGLNANATAADLERHIRRAIDLAEQH